MQFYNIDDFLKGMKQIQEEVKELSKEVQELREYIRTNVSSITGSVDSRATPKEVQTTVDN